MNSKERNFVEDPKMRRFWEKETYRHLKDRWDNGFQQFTFYRFVNIEYENLWEEWDEAEGMGSSDEDLVYDFTVGNYPIISKMYNDWGYEIEYAIVEYMDIVRNIHEKIGDGTMSENRKTIKKILTEDKYTRIVQMATKAIVDKFTTNQNDEKVDYRTLLMWKERHVDPHLKNMYGITEEGDSELYFEVISEWLSKALDLPKIGGRIKLISISDEYTLLKLGDEGTVSGYNNSPWGAQLSVDWDSGSTLDLMPDEDEWEVLS